MTRSQLHRQLKRAIAPEEKLERRASILAAAAALIHKDARASFSMDALAAGAKLAKGTLYLYFRTREEVLLAVHEKYVHELFDAFEAALDAPGADAASVLAAGIRYHRERPESYALSGNCHNLIDGAISVDAAVAFKLRLAQRIAAVGTRIEALIPGLAPGEGAALLINSHALIIGLWQQADVPERMRGPMERPELAPLRMDFERQLVAALADLWEGAQRRAAGAKS
ncbi:MAG: TetR family transcriptional regulator [Burkholderiales bacterium]